MNEPIRINTQLDPGAYLPTKAHELDAGADLRVKNGAYPTMLYPCDSCVIDTGVHVEIPEGYCGVLISKSGLNTVRGITSRGLIDAGFTGSIKVRLDRHDPQGEAYEIHAGDKISQLVILPLPLVQYVEAPQSKEYERGDNGYGSSGR